MTNTKLWQQVAAFQMDKDQSALSFTQRLARENGWSLGFARRVTEEYRRFIYLAACAGHPVTPSDEVDQAWHLHLVYTRSYWDDLCRDVLGKPLHHGPTEGRKREADKFTDWYARTLASYRSEFGEDPPRDIWPPSVVRFSPQARFQRVNVGDAWMISRSRVRQGVTLCSGVALLGTLLIACSGGSAVSDTWLVAGGWILVIGVVVVVRSISKSQGRKGQNSDHSHGCTGCGSSSNSSSRDNHSGCGDNSSTRHDDSDSGSSGCGSSSSGCGSSCGGDGGD